MKYIRNIYLLYILWFIPQWVRDSFCNTYYKLGKYEYHLGFSQRNKRRYMGAMKFIAGNCLLCLWRLARQV